MPSPVGHALGALSAGWLIARPDGSARQQFAQAATLAALGVAPDLDLVIGRHSAETHSLGAAVLAATLAASLRWPLARSRGRIWAAAFVAWFSHPLLDVLGTDTTAPFGVMLFWPLSQVHVLSGLAIFAAISRHWHQPGFAIHDLAAALRELLVLGPVAALVWGARHRPAAGHDADAVHAPGPPAGRGDATGAVG